MAHPDPEPDPIYWLDHVDLADQTISGVHTRDLRVIESTFDRCRFEDITVDDLILGGGRRPTLYRDCRFVNIKAKRVWASGRFERCEFTNLNTPMLHSVDAEFVDCHIDGRITGIMWGRVEDALIEVLGREVNQIEGNTFTGSIALAFSGGVDLRKQRLPQTDEHIYIDDLAATVQRLQEEPVLDELRSITSVLHKATLDGQRQDLLNLREFPKIRKSPEAVARLRSAAKPTL